MAWLPLRARLAAIFEDPERCDSMYEYFQPTEYSNGERVRDFFDGDAYLRIKEAYGGEEAIENDVFIALSTDGFQASRKKTYDVWPSCAVLCNLPPDIRLAVKNVIPFGFIPGPNEPIDLQSFLDSLVAEVEETNRHGGFEFLFYDGVRRRVRVHVVWFGGDLPAVKKASGIRVIMENGIVDIVLYRENGALYEDICTTHPLYARQMLCVSRDDLMRTHFPGELYGEIGLR